MSDRRDDRTEPMDALPPAAAGPVQRPTTWVGNAIAVVLVLVIGGFMAAGAVRAFVPTLGGATGASPTPSATAAASPSFTLRPLPSFTATPARTATPSPTPTVRPTGRPTPTVTAPPKLFPFTATPTPIAPRTTTPLPTRTP